MNLLYVLTIIAITYSLHLYCKYHTIKNIPKNKNNKTTDLFNYLIFISFALYIIIYYFLLPHGVFCILFTYFYCIFFLTMDTAKLLFKIIKRIKKK